MNFILSVLNIFIIRAIGSMVVSFRIIYSLQGRKLLSSCFGFFEASLFALIIVETMQKLGNPIVLCAYGLGFGAGSMFAVILEQKIGLGNLSATVILQGMDNDDLIDDIRDCGLGVTVLCGEGRNGPRDVLIVSLHRKDAIKFRQMILNRRKDAFVSIYPVNASNGYIKRLRSKGN
ncbi:MAG: DUF5698 domain-containing protein [Tissierellia bacterium]|nr:DUF5698 domain-containing protein [Tissierellia bacterium]